MPILEGFGSGSSRGFGQFGKIVANGLTAATAAVSAKQLKLDFPSIPSGIYWIDWGGPKQVYCEMSLEGGGWMMVLNYVRANGTNPSLTVRTNDFPMLNNQYTFGDESSSTGPGGYWGHISNSLAAQHNWSEYMFYGKDSTHSRVIHFRGNTPKIVTYFKTGSGTMAGGTYQGSNTYSDRSQNFNGSLYNNATIPLYCRENDNNLSGYSNSGDLAMTEFPMYGESALGHTRAHWGIKGSGSRWEMDDSDSSGNNIFRIWVR